MVEMLTYHSSILWDINCLCNIHTVDELYIRSITNANIDSTP